jgi:hypothetical protein
MSEKPLDDAGQEAFDYFAEMAENNWQKLDNRMSEAHTGLALLRLNRPQAPEQILKSFRERARYDEENGMFWSDMEFSYLWSQAPVETQTMMIEYFSELAPGTNEVERLQRWLLKQKQTQHWKTNRATADAIYALLPGGTEPLTDKLTFMDKVPVTVELGGVLALPEETEDGAFYREKRFAASEIRAGMGNVKISRAVDGTAWGGVFWEYFEDIAVITPHETPLSIDKKLFVRKMSESGPVIEPLEKQSVKPGDSLIVRIVLRTERDMQYVYMKDMRPSGTEPVNVLSGYRYQGGLSYYESIRDSAAHFYFYVLPQGSHVFEYELRIFHRGDYESGIAEVSCLYAPEFSAHSQSIRLPLNEPDI